MSSGTTNDKRLYEFRTARELRDEDGLLEPDPEAIRREVEDADPLTVTVADSAAWDERQFSGPYPDAGGDADA